MLRHSRESNEPTGLGKPARPSPSRRRARVLTILGAAAIVIVGWKAAPGYRDRNRIHRAERAIDDGRLDEARERLALLISEKPMGTLSRLLLARVARLQGHLTEAEEILQRAIELGLPVEQARSEHDLIARANER